MKNYTELINNLLTASSLEEVKNIVRSELLLPCPFCGRTDTVFIYDNNEMQMLCMDDDDYDENPEYLVGCDALYGGCGSSSGYKKTKEEAIQLWNTRY